MKTFCEVCTAAPATLVCCADDAVMCGTCDVSIHSANSVVQKHERVAFKSTSNKPNCDICQVNPVFAVCREDRAFLCRGCDLSIHSANEFVAKHERFLLTGITVDLHAMGPGNPGSNAIAAAAPVAAPVQQIQSNNNYQAENYQSQLQQQASYAAAAAAAKKAAKSGGTKRKAAAAQEEYSNNSFNSADLHVPTYDVASAMPDNNQFGGQLASSYSGQFSEFVSDFLGPNLGKGDKGDVSMANFLDGFFDDLDVSQDDFGVVPDMNVVR
eukprot:CAMPEP_0197574854 /NCGR_PEP_ID=MMETSP1326-20131121/446_1 /TAXON_ID=1155430 /ORGANISM="Genus nov. species nov., Strain RCC2288" /LENGTH=268 /DNA_ID=CAMNT_0043137511 /DNA_START=79 /DNA_END=885 /DNA_ORIENTATION=-